MKKLRRPWSAASREALAKLLPTLKPTKVPLRYRVPPIPATEEGGPSRYETQEVTREDIDASLDRVLARLTRRPEKGGDADG